jgi:hypothetical protein
MFFNALQVYGRKLGKAAVEFIAENAGGSPSAVGREHAAFQRSILSVYNAQPNCGSISTVIPRMGTFSLVWSTYAKLLVSEFRFKILAIRIDRANSFAAFDSRQIICLAQK